MEEKKCGFCLLCGWPNDGQNGSPFHDDCQQQLTSPDPVIIPTTAGDGMTLSEGVRQFLLSLAKTANQIPCGT